MREKTENHTTRRHHRNGKTLPALIAACLLPALQTAAPAQDCGSRDVRRGVIHHIDLIDNSLSVLTNDTPADLAVDSFTVFSGKPALADFRPGDTVIVILHSGGTASVPHADSVVAPQPIDEILHETTAVAYKKQQPEVHPFKE